MIVTNEDDSNCHNYVNIVIENDDNLYKNKLWSKKHSTMITYKDDDNKDHHHFCYDNNNESYYHIDIDLIVITILIMMMVI